MSPELQQTNLLPAVLTIKQAVLYTRVPRSTMYEHWSDATSDFPLPIRIGKRQRGLLREELDHWLKNRPRGPRW